MASGKDDSIIGHTRGKIGPVTLTTWKKLNIIKSNIARKQGTKQTEKQILQNEIFKLIIQFFTPAKPVINTGFQLPKNISKTQMNLASSFHMKNTIINVGDKRYIDLAKVKFSQPIKLTQQAWNLALTAEKGRKITITWELNPYPQKCSQPDDEVMIVIYNRNKDLYLVNWAVGRRDMLTYTYLVNKRHVGDDLFCYMFIASANGKLISETEYLGMVTVFN